MSKEDVIEVEGVVSEALPNTLFKVKLENQSIITVKGYNEIADFCYKSLIKNNYIALYGELDGKMEIVLKNVELIWKDIKIWDKKDRK